MKSKFLYAIIGACITIGGDIIVNLLSTAIQQRLPAQFSGQVLWILAALAIIGALAGYWLGEPLQLSATSAPPASNISPDVITMTRFRAILSYSKLKGKGIHLSNILLIGSRVDIET